MNIVILHGTVSADPSPRALSSGDVIWSFDVSAPTTGSTAHVPVAWRNPSAPPGFAVGDQVVVTGSVRRRFFRAGGVTQSRTEVVATEVVRASQRSRVRRLLTEAASALGSP